MTPLFCLAVGFIAPALFAAGAGAVSIPIAIHLLNRRRHRVVQWAAMDFLLNALRKNRRRLKFESLLLLLTRCAVLLLLGTALARPFGCQNNTIASLVGRRSGLHVFVIDNGYAMGYEFDRPNAKTHLDQAKIIAKQLINRLWAGSEAVAIITTADLNHPQPKDGQPDAAPAVPAPTYDLEAAKAIVDRIELSYAATDMPAALDRAKRVAVAATDLPNKSLYILDDSTRHVWTGPHTGGMAQLGQDLAKAYPTAIAHYNLGVPNEFNPAVMEITPAQRLNTLVGEFPASFVAHLRAFNDGPDSQLRWKIDDAQVTDANDTNNLHLDTADHPVTLGRAPFTTGGPHVVSATLSSDDRITCDDTRWHVVNVASDLKMLIVEGDRQVGDAGGSGLYLQAALAPDPDPADALAKKNRLVNIETCSDLEMETRPLGDYRCVALCDVGRITETAAARLESFVSGGGALWVFMGPQISSDNYNATLLKHHLLPGPLSQRIVVPAGANGTNEGVKFDFDPARPVHPLLGPFYQTQGSGLENARVYTYWQADIPANSPVERVLNYQALAGSTREDAAYTVHSVGRGRVVFCSTTADANDEWTAFPAKKAFPEVMLCLFLGTVSTDDDWMNLTIGDSVRPPASVKMTAAPQLHDAGGHDYPLVAEQTDDGPAYRSDPLTKPGVYTLVTDTASYPIAVNVPTEEADTRLLDSLSIRKVLGDINIDFQQDSVPHEESSQANEGKDFGWSIMLVVLGLAAAESFMAMKFGRFKRKT
jgi:hypothetical protein